MLKSANKILLRHEWPCDVFAVTLSLANRLQSKQVNIVSAHSHDTNVIEKLKALRSAAEDGFRKKYFCFSSIKCFTLVGGRSPP